MGWQRYLRYCSSFNFFLIKFDVGFTTVLAFPRDSMSFTVHCQLVVYHCRSWIHRRHGVWRYSFETPTFYQNNFIIISLLMFPLLGHRPSLWITHKENGPYPPRTPSAGWWVLTTANSGTNGLTYLLKNEELDIINFWSPI
jgi:hypothetical protein